MESAGVFKAAEYYDVPVITIRAISNLLDDAGNDLGTRPDALGVCADRLALCLTAILNRTLSLESITDSNQQKKLNGLITKYQFIQHPESSWYRQTFFETTDDSVNEAEQHPVIKNAQACASL